MATPASSQAAVKAIRLGANAMASTATTQDGSDGHHCARASAVDDAADGDAGEGGDQERAREGGGGGGGRPARGCRDLRIEDGEGVVDDSPAGDLGGAQGGQGGAGP